MRRLISVLLAAAALALVVQACSSSSPTPAVLPDGGTDGGGDGGLPDGGDGGLPDGGSDGGVAACLTAYSNCSIGTQCCSGTCPGGKCASPFCKATGATCGSSSECCSQNCSGNTCSATACKSTGTACGSPSECCSTTCNVTCQTTPGGGTCSTLGEPCAPDGLNVACCSSNCRSGLCVAAYSCQAYGDICDSNLDCCSAVCDLAGGTVGRCTETTGATSCGQDGVPCTKGNDCCTQVCIDLGGGVPVCAVASGCRVSGDTCENTQQCCGGGTNPNGSVICETSSRCDNGTSCNGLGTVCGKPVYADGGPVLLPDGGVFTVAYNTNCCNGKDTCHMDSAGIPRCYGGCSNQTCSGDPCPYGYTGQPGCCIAADQQCQFGDQCCNGLPCLPLNPADPASILVCTAPQCVSLGSTCTVGGTACCEGTCQVIEGGAYVCALPPGDGGVPDGGTDGGTTCRANGVTCSVGSECCSTYCIGGTCQAPQTCQPQNGPCTANADCCTGLSCSIPAGQTSGTCQPGATCPSAGQQCSQTTPCCPGLLCTDQGTFTLCTGTGVCVCVFAG